MSNKLNLLIFLNSYRDANPSNNPSMSQFKWQREANGISSSKPQSVEFCLTPGETRTLFNGSRTLLSDLTTEFDISLKSGGTYVLKNTAGTSPGFRTLRSIASDATTQVSVTPNAGLMTLSSVAGTAFDFTTTNVGDEVLVGDQFNSANRGRFKILSKTTTSITVENSSAVGETVTLGATFADQVRACSSSGVQIGDKIKLGSGFSLVNQNTYEITAVQDNLVEFFFSGLLPEEFSLLAPSVVIYSSAKKFMYLETDKKLSTTVNGSAESDVEPFSDGTSSAPGILVKSSVVYSFEVTNQTSDVATLYFASIE